MARRWHLLIPGLAVVIGFISVISQPRHQLLQVSDQYNIPVEFRIIAFSIPDYFMLGLVVLAAVVLATDFSFRERLASTLNAVILRWGGWWWLALTLWMVASIFWSPEPTLARFTALHAMFGLVMAFVIATLDEYEPVLLYGLLAGAVLQSSLAILQVLNGDLLGLSALGEVDMRFYYETDDLFRGRGLAMHPNYLGGYLMIAIIASLLLARRSLAHERLAWPFIAIGVLSTVGLVATFSRSAILALILILVPLAVGLLPRLTQRTRQLFIGTVGLGAILSVVLIIAGGGSVQDRFFSEREYFWDDTLDVIQDKTMTGAGAGNLMIEIGQDRFLSGRDLLPVHNVYAAIWAELGFVGMALFVSGCATIVWEMRRQDDLDFFIWTAGVLGIVIIMLFDNYFWLVQPFRVFFFWTLGMWWLYATRRSASLHLD